MNNEKMREEFEKWLLSVHGLEATWQEERNCFKEFPAHLAFQAWKASPTYPSSRLPEHLWRGW